MSTALLLVHGDDSLGIDEAIAEFATRAGAIGRTEVVPDRSPDEAAIEAATATAASIGLFGSQLAVLRQPLRAVGRSSHVLDRLLETIAQLPDGAALALAELRSSRDVGKPNATVTRLAEAVTARGGQVEERQTPRRGQLQAWIRSRAGERQIAIEPAAAALLAERVGGAVWETDVERSEQTRLADGELRKLATYAGERPIARGDVEALVADLRPASIYALTNAIDRREPAAAAQAVERALAEGTPVLRLLGALQGRVADLVVAADLAAQRTPAAEITRRVGRGNARSAERLVVAARRYRPGELEQMLIGLFEADLAVKSNAMEPEPALAAWVGEHLLATRG